MGQILAKKAGRPAWVYAGCLCPGGSGEPAGPTSRTKFRGPHSLLRFMPGCHRASTCPHCPALTPVSQLSHCPHRSTQGLGTITTF